MLAVPDMRIKDTSRCVEKREGTSQAPRIADVELTLNDGISRAILIYYAGHPPQSPGAHPIQLITPTPKVRKINDTTLITPSPRTNPLATTITLMSAPPAGETRV